MADSPQQLRECHYIQSTVQIRMVVIFNDNLLYLKELWKRRITRIGTHVFSLGRSRHALKIQ